ncbi:MAG: hypothetical protein LBV50_03475 [Novosphingobium sp.]|nr:hypothetical protein [Novosphingobium sp.]
MRQRERLDRLRTIADIRRVQELAARTTAMRVVREAGECMRERQARAAALDEAEAGWRQAVVESSPGEAMARIWLAAILQRVGELTVADERLELATAARERAQRATEMAMARRHIAGRAVKTAARRLQAGLEEDRGAALIDCYLIRRERP